jgi:hypothetical protein
MILGVFFNIILIIMISAGSEFLAREGGESEKMTALGGACVVSILFTLLSSISCSWLPAAYALESESQRRRDLLTRRESKKRENSKSKCLE